MPVARQTFLQMQNPSHSVSLQTRQSSPPLVPRRVIQWLHGVQIYLLNYEMGMVLVEGILLDVYQLWVYLCSSNNFVLIVYGLGWGRTRRIWEKGLCEFQTGCLAWLILWTIGFNPCSVKNWDLHQMCWWGCAPPIPCNIDPLSWLWRTVWVVIYVAYTP